MIRGNKMKKKYKIITSLIMFILIIIIIFYEIFKYPKEVAIFDSNTIAYYRNNKIVKVDYPNKINARYNFNKLFIYNNGILEEGYINIVQENDYNYFNVYKNDLSKINIYPLIAYTKKLNLKIYESKEETNFTDDELNTIKKVLSDNGLNDQYTGISKKSVKNINIYNINNFKNSDDEFYNIVFMIDNNDNSSVIDKSFYNKNLINIKRLDFYGLIDIDKDGENEIVVTETQGDDAPIYYYFYKYNSSKKTLNKIS